MPSPGLVAYFSVVRTGSRDEVEPGKSGFAHFFEHMMFRGTKKYPGPEYDRIVTGMGANSNAATTDDFTMYHLTIRQGKSGKGDRDRKRSLPKPQLRQTGLPDRGRRGLRRVSQEHHQSIRAVGRKADGSGLRRPHLQAHHHGFRSRHQGHARGLRLQPLVFQAFLSARKRGDTDRRRRRAESHFRLDPKILRRLEKRIRAAENHARTAADRRTRSVEISYPGKTLPILCLAYKGAAFDPDNRDFAAARLLNDLAFGETSELYKKLVIREQKVQFLFADVPMNRDMPLFTIVDHGQESRRHRFGAKRYRSRP